MQINYYSTGPTTGGFTTESGTHRATGDLAILIVQHMAKKVPIGIVLDRLEEYPHELDTDPETHRVILDWLRARHPDGI